MEKEIVASAFSVCKLNRTFLLFSANFHSNTRNSELYQLNLFVTLCDFVNGFQDAEQKIVGPYKISV